MPSSSRTLSLVLLLLFSCAPDRPSPPWSESVDAEPEVLPIKRRRVFAAAVDGGLGLLDADDGHLVAQGAGSVVDDVVLDRARGRLVTFEIDPDEEGGVIVARPFGAIGDATALGSSAGVVRFAATVPHVFVFEEAMGSRWRLLEGRTSAFAPTPRSTWMVGHRLYGLTWEPDGRWATRRVAIDGPDLGTIALEGAPPLSSEAARIVSVAGRVVPLEASSGTLRIDGKDTGLAASAVVDACPLSERTMAVFSSGPARLVVGPLGGPYAALEIAGQPRSDPRYLSRSLVATSATRVLVGTAKRVVAVHVRNGPSTALALDEHFVAQGAHAPIDGPIP